jgi:hypothetical protein
MYCMHSYNLATGTWTQWSQWTTCSKTCGVGESTRSRSCQGGACSGSGFESMDCTTTPCPGINFRHKHIIM